MNKHRCPWAKDPLEIDKKERYSIRRIREMLTLVNSNLEAMYE